MKVAKVSLVVTVFNEQDAIVSFLKSSLNQTLLPDEIIIVDGGSKDETLKKINDFKLSNKTKPKIDVFKKNGNRSIGRNYAISKTKNEIILSSDAGCILDKKWVEEIIKPFEDKKVDVVAGYYKGLGKNQFQKSLIPYVLVMKDRVNEEEFLPATRSIAFKKNIWRKVKGFDVKLSHNEDYYFAQKLKSKARIVFAEKAIVRWIPRNNFRDSFTMFLRFAYGDGESNLIRGKVLLIYARYLFFLYLLVLTVLEKSLLLLSFVILLPLLYIIWSVKKNYRYV
jgi:glycosyltransferase involved in cell wall biosynthesis